MSVVVAQPARSKRRAVQVQDGDLLVLVALPEEAAPIAARLKRRTAAMRGLLGQRATAVVVCGPGPAWATATLRHVLEQARPAAIICAGLGGGLRPNLGRGEVVVAEHIQDDSGSTVYSTPASLLQAVPRLQRVTLLTASRIVGTAAEKALLATAADVVDMESAAAAKLALQADIPFLALRSISDEAHENFPIDLNRYMDKNGGVKRPQLALAALSKRGGLSFLLRMRRTARQATERLAQVVEEAASGLPIFQGGAQ